MAVSYRRSIGANGTGATANGSRMLARGRARVVRRAAYRMRPGGADRMPPYPGPMPRSRRSRRSTASRRGGPRGGRPTASTASTARAERADVFSIDTPPPTVSGSIHMGTVFGYTQTDAIARQRRMAGKSVFFPIGWDDNGLATERRVQNYYGVRCDPSQPYDPGFQPPFRGDAPKDHQEIPISRPNFVELCHELTATDEAVFEDLFRRLGLSYDWSLKYETINDVSRRTSQQAFLHNLARGEAYSAEAPTVWDVDDRTAVAQAEIEDRERPGAYHLLAFHGPDGDVLIDTTRPELVVSCVALVAHPDDERYAPLVGTTVRTPIFDVEVPVVAHPLAQPDKGTGIAMVCTFGDTTDVTWWRELDLPTRSVIGRDGRIVAGEPSWLTDGRRPRGLRRRSPG